MKICFFLYFLFSPAIVFSGVIPETSRVIFDAKNTIKSSILVNTNKYPVVVQLWVDDGEFNKKPEQTDTPFVVTPATARMEPLKLSEMKIIYSGDPQHLPTDRESLFWINILEIPPVNKKSQTENEVTLSMLTQIKLIYRPISLMIKENDLLTKLDNIKVSLVKESDGVINLNFSNPEAYVASLTSVTLLNNDGRKVISLKNSENMNLTLLPRSLKKIPINYDEKTSNISSIEYWLVDDIGRFFHKRKSLL
ncbi:hypothetical protein NAL19_2415 [Pectobacterium sp. F1-1]|uniref:fimbrial biogenesis chaperone n=1 Tax=Pectobacterium TaxID=122277 RepID=UPI001CD39EB2|nr:MULTISPECIES: molecular chaperone [Pectobacterium]UYA60546.1 hypothetical protein NAL19_2415 [Pectobacterium sp. F1-1]